MYYKSLIETLKDEDTDNRIILNEQVTDANNCYIDITLVTFNNKRIRVYLEGINSKIIKLIIYEYIITF